MSHPEDTCRRCGGPNVSWSAPSPLWNAVMRGGSISGPSELGELICPTCFFVLAEERGIASGWVVGAIEVHVDLETVTPSGRTWDPEQMLWLDAPQGKAAVNYDLEHAADLAAVNKAARDGAIIDAAERVRKGDDQFIRRAHGNY